MQAGYKRFNLVLKLTEDLMNRPASILLLLIASSSASAGWVLNNDASRVNFVSTKANVAAEVHTFKQLEGMVDDDGNATVSIDLNSVDTSIEIRDQRMREMLFDTARYPAATIVASIEPGAVKNLEPGSRTQLISEGQLQIHGTTVSVTLDLNVARLNDSTLLVSSVKPVIINAGQSGLAAGVEKLREVAGLPSISPAVPVTFELTFDRE